MTTYRSEEAAMTDAVHRFQRLTPEIIMDAVESQ
jgi:hypothetical protein